MSVPVTLVVGSPRSGTTFLMRALDALPRTECVTGLLLPVAVPHVLGRGGLAPEIREALVVGFERSVDAYLHSGRFHSRARTLDKWQASRDGLRGLADALRGRRRVDRFVFKEPFLSLAPDLALDAFPDAQILHIYRDGRDVANSLLRTYATLTDEALTHLRGSEMRLGRRYDERYVPWWVEEGADEAFIASPPYARAAWMWAAMSRRCRHAFARPEVAGRVISLCYEDLMRRPAEEGARLAEALGAEPTRPFRRALSRAHTGSIGSFRRRPAAEVAAAEAAAADELRAHGYALAHSLAPVP